MARSRRPGAAPIRRARRSARPPESRSEPSRKCAVASSESASSALLRTAIDSRPVREHVARRLARRARVVLAARAAQALLAVAAVVGDERIVLRQRRSRLGHGALRRVVVAPAAPARPPTGRAPCSRRRSAARARGPSRDAARATDRSRRAARLRAAGRSSPGLRRASAAAGPAPPRLGRARAGAPPPGHRLAACAALPRATPARGEVRPRGRRCARPALPSWSSAAARVAGSVAAWSQAKRAFCVSPSASCASPR